MLSGMFRLSLLFAEFCWLLLLPVPVPVVVADDVVAVVSVVVLFCVCNSGGRKERSEKMMRIE